MKQGTKEWLEFRKKGLGASDAPVVMGLSPYRTVRELWEEKTGRRDGQKQNYAMTRGKELEEEARESYIRQTEIHVEPAIVIHPKHEFIFASLDGLSSSNTLVEIKCPMNKDDHEMAKSGAVPEKYLPQVHQQIMVKGAQWNDYFSYRGPTDTAMVRVYRDPAYEFYLLAHLLRFWDYVVRDEPPEPADGEHVLLSDPESIARFEKWKSAKLLVENANAIMKAARDEIIANVKEDKAECAGVRFTRSERIGSIDFGRIPELKGVDLEKYRKGPVDYITIEEKKRRKDERHTD